MYLSDIATQPEMHMVLVQSDCVRLIQFMQDKIKRKFKINRDSEIIVNSYKDLYQIKEVQGIIPPLSDKWYVVLDLDKLDSGAVEKAIKTGDTCIFFCMCTKYTTYKKYKELSDAEFYMSYLKKRDIVYLYDAFVSEKNKLNKQLFSYFINSYSSDVEAIFDLITANRKFNSKQEIISLCGVGGLSIENFIFSLTGDISGSEKGLKTVVKNKMTMCIDLAENLGYDKFYFYLNKAILRFCEIKMLIINGKVYKTIYKVPEGYDERLASYNKYIWKLNQIPMTKLLLIKQALGNKVFRSQIDCLDFIYRYYNIKQERRIKNV